MCVKYFTQNIYQQTRLDNKRLGFDQSVSVEFITDSRRCGRYADKPLASVNL